MNGVYIFALRQPCSMMSGTALRGKAFSPPCAQLQSAGTLQKLITHADVRLRSLWTDLFMLTQKSTLMVNPEYEQSDYWAFKVSPPPKNILDKIFLPR